MVMTFAFTSEAGAERFVEFLASAFEIESEVLSYLHVEIYEEDLPTDERSLALIESRAEEYGADSVLL
jgi:hypothetical protein